MDRGIHGPESALKRVIVVYLVAARLCSVTDAPCSVPDCAETRIVPGLPARQSSHPTTARGREGSFNRPIVGEGDALPCAVVEIALHERKIAARISCGRTKRRAGSL